MSEPTCNTRPELPGKAGSARPSEAQGRAGASWSEPDAWSPESAVTPLSGEQVAALRAKEPMVSPWWVVMVQAGLGVVAAVIGWLATGRSEVGWSLLYGAATVVLPGALMARGMTSRLSSVAPGVSAVSFMLWESVKIGVSVVMLALAGHVVQPLVWPALLVGLVVCMKVYWVALLWRRRKI